MASIGLRAVQRTLVKSFAVYANQELREECQDALYTARGELADQTKTGNTFLDALKTVDGVLQQESSSEQDRETLLQLASDVLKSCKSEELSNVLDQSTLSDEKKETVLDAIRLQLDIDHVESNTNNRRMESNALSLRFALAARLQGLAPSAQNSPALSIVAKPSLSEEQVMVAELTGGLGIKRVTALAGTGKTLSVMEFLAQRAESGESGLYVCFGKANKKSFVERCQLRDLTADARTINSIAFQEVVMCDPRALQKFKVAASLTVSIVQRVLSLGGERLPPLEGKLYNPKNRLAARVLKTVEQYMASKDGVVSQKHICPVAYTDGPEHVESVLDLAQRLWDMMVDMNNLTAPLPFSAHVKLLQLRSRPFYNKARVVVIDEVQDTSEAEQDIFLRLSKTKLVLLVGDRYQYIYGFKHASTNWLDIPVDEELSLTGSFRFPQPIADHANDMLDLCGTEQRLSGLAQRSSTVFRPISVSERPPQGATMLFRLNFTVIQELLRLNRVWPELKVFLLMRDGGDTAQAEGMHPQLQMYADAARLRQGDPRPCGSRSKALKSFETWKQFAEHVEDLEGTDGLLASILQAQDRLRDPFFLGSLLKAGQQLVDNREEADVMLTTVHQAKGLTFHTVIVGEELQITGCIEAENTPAYEENCLLYVALTRASHIEFLNGHAFRMALRRVGQHNFTTNTTSTHCSRCASASSPLIDYEPYFPQYSSDPEKNSPAPFPCCTNCAKDSTYSPLQDYAKLLEIEEKASRIGWPKALGQLNSVATDESEEGQFTAGTEESSIQKELERETFW